jgi:hypothetical protein
MTPTRNVTVNSSLISARTLQKEISLESRTEGLQVTNHFKPRDQGNLASDDFGGFYNGVGRNTI